MKIVKPENATRVLAQSQDEYLNLPIVDIARDDGVNVMVSLWQPSPDELEALNNGACISLGILGTNHPPVIVFVNGMEEGDQPCQN